MTEHAVKHRWREYKTASGNSPVCKFLMDLEPGARAEVAAAMKDVRENGLQVARHLDGDIYEVRASHDKMTYRMLFAQEGGKGRILLSLEAFNKKTQKTPKGKSSLAKSRLSDWRARAAKKE